jgi:hypothetical protein
MECWNKGMTGKSKPIRIIEGSVVLILALIFLAFSSVFSQVRVGEVIAFPGIIEKVSEDFRFIVVNEAKIDLSSITRVSDDAGKDLKINDLKAKSRVQLEVLRTGQGLLAQKIMVKRKK